MSGTDLASAAPGGWRCAERIREAQVSYPICLRIRYTMSDTDVPYHAARGEVHRDGDWHRMRSLSPPPLRPSLPFSLSLTPFHYFHSFLLTLSLFHTLFLTHTLTHTDKHISLALMHPVERERMALQWVCIVNPSSLHRLTRPCGCNARLSPYLGCPSCFTGHPPSHFAPLKAC
eukprot:3881648-Rhodomonas_salina.4